MKLDMLNKTGKKTFSHKAIKQHGESERGGHVRSLTLLIYESA